MQKIHRLVVLSAFLGLAAGPALGDDPAEKYGVKKERTDTVNTRTDTYKKEVGKTDSGKGYGVYGSSTKEYKNDGERDTSANEKENGGSKGAGVYIEY